jgi:hypothetical protein
VCRHELVCLIFLSLRYAAQQFRKVPVDLGRAASAEYNYLDIIAEATKGAAPVIGSAKLIGTALYY